MFEHFTSRARETVELARQEATVEPHGVVTTGYLLLALAARSDTATVQASFADVGDLVRLRRAVEEAAADGGEPVHGRAKFSEKSDEALAFAFREALERGQSRLDTGHLALGLLRDGNDAVIVLRSLGMNEADLSRRAAENLPPRTGQVGAEPEGR